MISIVKRLYIKLTRNAAFYGLYRLVESYVKKTSFFIKTVVVDGEEHLVVCFERGFLSWCCFKSCQDDSWCVGCTDLRVRPDEFFPHRMRQRLLKQVGSPPVHATLEEAVRYCASASFF